MKRLNSPASNLALSLSCISENSIVSQSLSFNDSESNLSEIECLGLSSFLNLSVNKYKSLRKFLIKKNINILIRYENLLSFKKSFIPSSLSLTENCAKMPVVDILKKFSFFYFRF